MSYALTTFVSSLSSSTIVTLRNSVPSIIIVATTAWSNILLTWSSIKIISVNFMYTGTLITIFSLLLLRTSSVYFFYNITSSGICNLSKFLDILVIISVCSAQLVSN